MLFYSVPGSRSSTTGFEAGTAVKRSVGAARRLSSRVTSESVLRAAQACSCNSTQRLFASGKHTCKTAAPAGKRCLRVRANPAEAVDCNQGMGPGRSAWLPSRAQACPDLKKKESSTIRFLHLQARQDGGSGTDATEIRPGRKSETRPYRRLSRAQLCAGPDPRDVTGLTGSLSRKAPLQRIMKLLILETLLLSNGELCYVNYRPLNAPNEVPDDHY